MYNKMHIELFGLKLRVDVLVISMLIGAIMGCHLLCSCTRISAKEGMQMIGAAVDYTMGTGVQGSWDTRAQEKGPSVEWRSQNHDATGSNFVGPDKSMSFFADTQFKPECCGATYSSQGGLTTKGVTSSGCACLNKEQMEYINQRGGNRTMGGDF